MRGQYRILSEVLLFTLGVAITSFVILSFQNARDYITRSSMENQLEAAANIVSSSVIRGSGKNSVIILRVPDRLSEAAYRIFADCDENECTMNAAALESKFSASRRLFNMGLEHNIRGDVTSTSRYLEVVSLQSAPKNLIEIRRHR